MILSPPLLITLAQTKALACPPIPLRTTFPWLAVSISVRKLFSASDCMIEETIT